MEHVELVPPAFMCSFVNASLMLNFFFLVLLSEDFLDFGLVILVLLSYVSGKSTSLSTSAKRAGHLIRPTSPKSPVASASASAFESVEGSDDEDNLTENTKLDTSYLHTNGSAVSSL